MEISACRPAGHRRSDHPWRHRQIKVTLYGPSPEIKDPWGLARRGLRLEGRLNRQDFGITYNKLLDNGGLMIGDLVDAEADIEVVGAPGKWAPE